MTPQELREALIDIIERLQAAQGDQLLATLKQAMTMLGPREKFAMLQAALGSLKGSEHDRFLETLQNGWYKAGGRPMGGSNPTDEQSAAGASATDAVAPRIIGTGGGKAGTSKQVELTLGTYLLLPEQGRLAFLKAGVKEMGESEKAFLGLDRRTRSVAIMTVEAAQAAIEAAAAAEQAATDERARAEAAAAKQAEEKRKELMEQNKGAAAIQARAPRRRRRPALPAAPSAELSLGPSSPPPVPRLPRSPGAHPRPLPSEEPERATAALRAPGHPRGVGSAVQGRRQAGAPLRSQAARGAPATTARRPSDRQSPNSSAPAWPLTPWAAYPAAQYISAIFEAKLVSDAACDREGRRRPPFTQLAHFTLQSTPPGQDRAAASHTLASMLVSAANYEALPGARPEGSLRVELFAIVAGMAGLGPLGPGKYSAHAATFFFDVLQLVDGALYLV